MNSKIIFTVLVLACVISIFGCAKEEPVVRQEPEVRVVIEAEETKELTPEEEKVADKRQVITEPRPHLLEEIQDHNAEENCWITIDGHVYDFTEFIPKHPGGEKIVSSCGTDATETFNAIDKHFGKEDSLDEYYIGSLEGYKWF